MCYYFKGSEKLLTFLAIPASFIIFFILIRIIAGPLAGMYHMGAEQSAIITSFLLIFIFSFLAGFLSGMMGRDRIGPLFGGIIAVIYILSVNDNSLISRAIFYAPYANLAADNVLLGLSLILFTFLWSGKLGEQYGFRQDRNRLLPDGVS
jgi:hypothetical protein